MSTFLLASTDGGWRYAAWVVVDFRLLVFVVLISALAGAGLSALLVKKRQWQLYAATFFLSFTTTLIFLIVVFNAIAEYPVFAIRTMFPFP
jgi:hypothetical protein